MLPSDFGYLEAKNSPRNLMSTQGSFRPRMISRLQLSTMTGNVDHNLGEISINATDRETQKSMTANSVKKRKNLNDSMFKRQRTGGTNDLMEDSINVLNQLTNRD